MLKGCTAITSFERIEVAKLPQRCRLKGIKIVDAQWTAMMKPYN
jgi:hypothetical protein